MEESFGDVLLDFFDIARHVESKNVGSSLVVPKADGAVLPANLVVAEVVGEEVGDDFVFVVEVDAHPAQHSRCFGEMFLVDDGEIDLGRRRST
jgi:hypothetical protein